MLKFFIALIVLIISLGMICHAECRHIVIEEVLAGVLAGICVASVIVLDRVYILRETSIAMLQTDLLHEVLHAFLGGFLAGLAIAVTIWCRN